MKKTLIALAAVTAMTGCAYDYYDGNVRYVQDGTDCIYTFDQDVNRYNSRRDNLDESKRIVYRDTICSQLFNKEIVRTNPVVAAPMQQTTIAPAPVAPTCGRTILPTCVNGCGASRVQNVRRSYIVVPTGY
ncbi:hypothetical protein FACS18945_2400 [Bacteroidia bacterium]|nr:hypothetical protein FACS18945_2400 [Bacteroidia bacterium]